MSASDAEEELNPMLESSLPARESSPTEREEEDSQFINMQTELHSKGAVLTKAWSDLFSFITKYQAELVVKENSVEIAEKEIEQRKRQLEEMKPVVDAGNEEITQLQDEIRTKERLLSKAQSQLSVKERMLERVQSDLSCSRELLEKSQSDLLGKQNDLIRNRGNLERLKSDLKLKQEQIQIKDNLLKKLQNQLMKENAELKEQLELERRSYELEKQSHELTKRSLVSQSMQSERRKRQSTEAVQVSLIEIPDSPPTYDLSEAAEDFGPSKIISMTTDTPSMGQKSSNPSPRRLSSRLNTSRTSGSIPSATPSSGGESNDLLHHLPSGSRPKWSFSTPSKITTTKFTSLPSIPSQTSLPNISDNIPKSDVAMTSSDTFFPLSVSEDVKPAIDALTSCIETDIHDNMTITKPGTRSASTRNSNQGPVPVSGPILSPGMSAGGSTDGRAVGKIVTEPVFPTETWSGVEGMEIGMVWSLAPTVDSVQADHKVLQGWSLAETVDLTEGDDFKTADLAKDEDLHSDEADFVEDHSNEDFIPVSYSKAVFTMESSSALQPEYALRKHKVCNMNEKMLLKKILKSNLKTSGNLQTKPKERFKCTICKKAFRHEGFLRKHKQQHTRKFECRFCQKTFSGKAYLAKHEKSHTDEKIHAILPSSSNVFKDMVSSEKFGSEDDLTLLELKQKISEKKSLECRYCKKAFSSKDSLTRHELTHNFRKKEFRCNFCKKAFSLKEEVAVHELTHLDTGGEKATHELTSAQSQVPKRTKYRPFRCKRPGCKKSFARRKNLKHHELTHTRVWRYQCSYCEKAFKWKGVMKIHEKNHQRAKPLPVFECSLCHMEFVYKSVYEKHVCKVQI